jgi:hypothetical protein
MRLFARFLPMILLLAGAHTGIAQVAPDTKKTGLVRGRLMLSASGQPATDVQVTLPALKQLVNSDGAGYFSFSQVPYGIHTLIVSGPFIDADTIRIYVHDAVADIRDVIIVPSDSGASPQSLQIPTIALEENGISTEDEGLRTGPVSGLLAASRDPFTSTIAFVFGPYRFQPRGYGRSSQEVQINGSPMNDAATGDAYWGQWGGLNDVFRSRSNTYGLQPSEYVYGGIGGSVCFDAAASGQRKQTRATYSLTNRSYRSRIMFTRSSGLMKNGWAYSLSASRRWAQEGYIPGTFYDGYSYYAGVSKRFGGSQELNFVTFGAPTSRGKSAAITAETAQLAGSPFYNPAWGFQGGKKRDSRVGTSFQPVAILDYRYMSSSLYWQTSLACQTGKTGNTGLDYYNGSNPRPDYYRYLPSYYILSNTDPSDPDPGAKAEFNKQQQIDWDRIYSENSINYDSVLNEAGIAGNTVRGRRSITVLYRDVEVTRKFSLNSRLAKVLNPHVALAAGLQAITQQTESYRELADLLGGDFYLNLNQFAFQQNVPDITFNQYDLVTPDRAVRAGEKYNYHYISHFLKGNLWAQGTFTFNRVDLFLSMRGGYTAFSREGLYRNGLFADISYGRSSIQRFTTCSVKGGATYKINGRNYLFANAGYSQDAPAFENTFISPRSRNVPVANPVPETSAIAEAGYLMRTPKYNIRVVGYATDTRDAAEIKRYYNDDPAFRGFVNYVIQGINARYTGIELAAELKLLSSLSITGVAALGQAFYTGNPSSVTVYRDNDTVRTPAERQVFIGNYYIAAGPQSACTAGLAYRAKQYWYASVNLNYFDRNYIDISPDQRTGEAVAGLTPGSEQYRRILAQERLPPVFTVDISGGKSWILSKYLKQLPKGTFLYLNAGVSNLLNTVIRTGGFEQLRYDFSGKEPGKFAVKYFYGLGRNFFLNLSLKF